MVKVWSVLVVVAACQGSEPPPAKQMVVDLPDPAGDHAVDVGGPLDYNASALPGELPLRAFSCTKSITGKRENGQLEVTFVPRTPTDVSLRIQFRAAQSACNYSTELRLDAGRLNDGVLGRVNVYRCRRSPLSAFAVSCGPYLGSDLDVSVHGNTWGRTIAFRIPWTFHEGMARADVCTLPFAVYDEIQRPQGFQNRELVFDFGDCHWET